MADNRWSLRGKVVADAGNTVPEHLRVVAWDRDFHSEDDFLAETAVSPQNTFEFAFESRGVAAAIQRKLRATLPDVYLQIRNSENLILGETPVHWNLKPGTYDFTVHITVPAPRPAVVFQVSAGNEGENAAAVKVDFTTAVPSRQILFSLRGVPEGLTAIVDSETQPKWSVHRTGEELTLHATGDGQLIAGGAHSLHLQLGSDGSEALPEHLGVRIGTVLIEAEDGRIARDKDAAKPPMVSIPLRVPEPRTLPAADPGNFAHLPEVLAEEARSVLCSTCKDRDLLLLEHLVRLYPEHEIELRALPGRVGALEELAQVVRTTFIDPNRDFFEGSPLFVPLGELAEIESSALPELLPHIVSSRLLVIHQLAIRVAKAFRSEVAAKRSLSDFLDNPGIVLDYVRLPFADDVTEFVQLRNVSAREIDTSSWSLCVATEEGKDLPLFARGQIQGFSPNAWWRIFSGKPQGDSGVIGAGHDAPVIKDDRAAITLRTAGTGVYTWRPCRAGMVWWQFTRGVQGLSVRNFVLLKECTKPGGLQDKPWDQLSGWGEEGRPHLGEPQPVDEDEGRRLLGSSRVAIVAAPWPRWPLPWGPYPPVWPPIGWPPKPWPLPPDPGPGIGIDRPVIACKLEFEGPTCACLDENVEYHVTHTCPGDCQDWDIDEPSIARIVAITGCSARVLILSEGEFTISVNFVYPGGGKVALRRTAKTYGVFHVLGGTTDSRISSVPLIQPHPQVRIMAPAETPPDQHLPASAFHIDPYRLQDGWGKWLAHEIDLTELAMKYLAVDLPLMGSISDFYEAIPSLRVRIIDHEEEEIHPVKDEDYENSSIHIAMDAPQPRRVTVVGLGEHAIQAIATNAIGREGSDVIMVNVQPDEDRLEAVSEKRAELAALRRRVTPPATIDEIRAKEREMAEAWLDAISHPWITVSHNEHVDLPIALTENMKTRTQGRDADKGGHPRRCRITAGMEVRDLTMRQEGATVYLTDDPVDAYWVAPDSYTGNKYTWDVDGMLRAKRADDLISSFQCCGRTAPIFGVEANVSPCMTLSKTKQGELDALGEPRIAPDGAVGQYCWSVISKPKNAHVALTRDGFGPSGKIGFTTDTSGYYTFKVEYSLGRGSMLTYALADVAVTFKHADAATWSIVRLGDYPGHLANHKHRPLYQERRSEPLHAADVLVRPDGGDVFGKRFSGSLVIPGDLEFADGLSVRVYLKPYAPDLTPSDYLEFSAAPAVVIRAAAHNEALIDVRTDDDIHAVHFIRMRYGNCQRLKGQAVPLHFAFTPSPAMHCPGAAVTPPDSGAPHVLIADGDPITSTPPGRRELLPLITVVLYNRDLGLAPAGHAWVRMADTAEHVNAANGNCFLQLPVFQANGHGQNLALSFVYNSLQATYQDSLDLLRSFNGQTDADIARDWCPSPIGKGWTHNYNVYVRRHVRSTDADANVLEVLAELVAPDGNRILFREERREQGLARYRPLNEDCSWLGSPHFGHSLRMDATLDPGGTPTRWDLRILNGERLRFDADGNLLQWSNRLIDGSPALKPLQVADDPAGLKITDSRDRHIVLPKISPGADHFAIIPCPEQMQVTINFERGLFAGFNLNNVQNWSFEYRTDLQPLSDGFRGADISGRRPSGVLGDIHDPRGLKNHIRYYNGEAFEGIEQRIARDYWGCFGSAEKGENERQRKHIAYCLPYDPQTLRIVWRDSRSVECLYVISRSGLVAHEVSLIRQTRDSDTGRLTGLPCYADVLAGNIAFTDLSLALIVAYSHHMATKLVSGSTDLQGNTTTFAYGPHGDGHTFLRSRIIHSDGTTFDSEYDSDLRLTRVFNPYQSLDRPVDHPFTELVYDQRNNLTRKNYPAIPGASDVHEAWTYDSDTGRVETLREKNGVVWRYGYGDVAATGDDALAVGKTRDPENTGLPTSRAMTKAAGDPGPRLLRWEQAYDSLGRHTWRYEPHYGSETNYSFWEFGPVKDTVTQPIPTSDGRVTGETITLHYDPMLNIKERFDGDGHESWEYDDFGDAVAYHSAGGQVTRTIFDKGSYIVGTVDSAGIETTTVHDELGRILRVNFPKPSADRPAIVEVHIYNDEVGTASHMIQRYEVDQPGGTLRGRRWIQQIIHRLEHGYEIAQIQRQGFGAATIENHYTQDRWGAVASTTLLVRDVRVRSSHVERDDWGRAVTTAHRAEGEERTETAVYDVDNRITSRTLPSVDGHTPRIVQRFDTLGRLRELEDAEGRIVRRIRYTDAGPWRGDGVIPVIAEVVEEGQSPARLLGEEGLQFIHRTQFNRLGLPVQIAFDDGEHPARKRQIQYDAAGRKVLTVDEYGTEIATNYTRGGKVDYVHRRVRNALSGNPGHVIEDNTTTFYEYDSAGRLHQQRGGGQFLRVHFDALGRSVKRERGFSSGMAVNWSEELQLDSFDRVLTRRLKDGSLHTFTYDDFQRSIVGTFTMPTNDTRLVTESTYDFENRVLDFRYSEYMPKIVGGFVNLGARLTFQYNNWGELETKEYRRYGGDLLATQTYRHNALGLRRQLGLVVKRPGDSDFVSTTNYTYDANLRLEKIDEGSGFFFRFDYNAAGFCKRIRRPFIPFTTVDRDLVANETLFTHDTLGRTTLQEEFGGQGDQKRPLSRLQMGYGALADFNHPSDPWQLSAKQLASPDSPSIRSVRLERLYAGPDHVVEQRYGYDGEGFIHASITSQRGGAQTEWDFRVREQGGVARGSSHRHLQRRDAQGRVSMSVPFSEDLYYPTATHAHPVNRFGHRGDSATEPFPLAYRQVNELDAIGNLSRRRTVPEDGDRKGRDPLEGKLQITRRYLHDPMGRLVFIGEMLEAPDELLHLSPDETVNQSMEIHMVFQHGPNGEPFFRTVQWWTGNANGVSGQSHDEYVLTLTDQGRVLGTYFSHTGRMIYHTLPPGLDYRLCTTISERNILGVGSLLPRYDHRGSTIFATTMDGTVVGEFSFAGADGERDLFGRDGTPSWLGPTVLHDVPYLQIVLADTQSQSSPRIDVVLNTSSAREQQARMVASMGLDPAEPAGASNDYALAHRKQHAFISAWAAIDPGEWAFGIDVLTVQAWIDRWHGFQDVFTFNASSKIRELVYGPEASRILDGRAYFQGAIAGVVASFGLGLYGASRFASLGAMSMIFAYDVIGITAATAHGLYALATGTFDWTHAVGMIPVIGFGLGAAWLGLRALPWRMGRIREWWPAMRAQVGDGVRARAAHRVWIESSAVGDALQVGSLREGFWILRRALRLNGENHHVLNNEFGIAINRSTGEIFVVRGLAESLPHPDGLYVLAHTHPFSRPDIRGDVFRRHHLPSGGDYSALAQQANNVDIDTGFVLSWRQGQGVVTTEYGFAGNIFQVFVRTDDWQDICEARALMEAIGHGQPQGNRMIFCHGGMESQRLETAALSEYMTMFYYQREYLLLERPWPRYDSFRRFGEAGDLPIVPMP